MANRNLFLSDVWNAMMVIAFSQKKWNCAAHLFSQYILQITYLCVVGTEFCDNSDIKVVKGKIE